MTSPLGRPKAPDIFVRLRALERLVNRLTKAPTSPSRETIAPRNATAAWAQTSATVPTDLVYLTHLLARNALTVQVWALTSTTDTVATLQLWDYDRNLELANQQVSGVTQQQVSFIDVPYLGAPGDRRDIRLRASITDGTGSVSVLPIYAYSAASPA